MRPSLGAADRTSIMVEAAMPTICLRFWFEEHPRIRALMEACADIQRRAIAYALENGKTATFAIIQNRQWKILAQRPMDLQPPHDQSPTPLWA
jgi:hypothetical protein